MQQCVTEEQLFLYIEILHFISEHVSIYWLSDVHRNHQIWLIHVIQSQCEHHISPHGNDWNQFELPVAPSVEQTLETPRSWVQIPDRTDQMYNAIQVTLNKSIWQMHETAYWDLCEAAFSISWLLNYKLCLSNFLWNNQNYFCISRNYEQQSCILHKILYRIDAARPFCVYISIFVLCFPVQISKRS